MYQSIGIVGCGLIGGSLALSIHKQFPNITLYGIDPKANSIKNHPQATCFKLISDSITDLPADLDIIFIATPINDTLRTIKILSNHTQKSTVLTDVTSTKETLINTIKELSLKRPYISGHPMAGKETTGFEAASETLFNEAPYIIIENNHKEQEEILTEFLTEMSCRVITQSAKKHDELIAIVSHLPYLTATALIQVASKNNSHETIQSIYGPGFKDSTRLAASSPQWGTDICTHNKESITAALDSMIETLKQLKSLIQTSETQTLINILNRNKEKKDKL